MRDDFTAGTIGKRLEFLAEANGLIEAVEEYAPQGVNPPGRRDLDETERIGT